MTFPFKVGDTVFHTNWHELNQPVTITAIGQWKFLARPPGEDVELSYLIDTTEGAWVHRPITRTFKVTAVDRPAKHGETVLFKMNATGRFDAYESVGGSGDENRIVITRIEEL
jgi:hypothetical protein